MVEETNPFAEAADEWEDEALLPPADEPIYIEADTDTGPGVELPSADTEPHGDPLDETEPLTGFDERHKRDFEGLLYIGALEDSFDWLGHDFVIRTLTTGELLRLTQVHAEYVDTIGFDKAYQAAVVAACVVSVDGKPLPEPLERRASDIDVSRSRFKYVLGWYPQVLDVIYSKYRELEGRVEAVIDQMLKHPG